MHNQTKTILALLLLTVLTAIAYAQYGPGQALPSAFNVVMQINDARAAAGLGYPLCTPWSKGLANYPPYSFAAGKNFTLIIRETASSPVYPPVFQDYRVSAVANSTGFVTFNINVPAGVDVTKRTNWYVAIVVEWPRPGYYFLIYNQTFTNATFIDVIGNLSGRPDLTDTKTYTGPWGVIKVTNGANRFGNLSSSVIHTYYIGINTLGKPFTLTLTRTITIAGTTITLDDNVGPARGPTNYVVGYDPNVNVVFGPFAYLSTYVISLGGPGKTVTIDPTKVFFNHYVYITIEGLRGVVIQSKNDQFTAFGGLRYVAITLNKTAGPGTSVSAPMSCGLIIWNMTMYTVKITGLLDLKGNPIFNPENFRYKIQLRVGDSWVTLDRAQASWRLDLSDVKAVLNQVCGTIKTFTDIMYCYRTLGPNEFRQAVLKLYEPVTLARLGGQLQLTNDNAKVSTADLTSKLVVEYSYTAGQDSVKAVVLEVALAELANFQGVLNVSVLPVQIRLWRWSNYSLPPSVPTPREYFYTDPLDLASLRFEVTGDTMYINRMAYDGAISYDPWLGQVIWVLPPYQPVPGLVGNVKASLLSLFNASGYLPMPPLVANLTTGGVIKYFNYSDVAANADFFKPFQIGLVGSYAYKFRIYSGDALVGTANVVAYYPVINASGLLYHSKAGDALQAVYDDNMHTDMYAVQIVTPGRFYDREHVIHIAIARIFQNILMKDACGNPVMGVSAGFAGASISLIMKIGGKNITIAKLPVGSEVPVDIMVPIDEWGNPQLDLKGGYISAYVVLNYFGYTLYPVDDLAKLPASAPVWFNIPIKFGVVKKPVIYLPIAPLNFRVWSQAVSVEYDPLKEPLMGFVVRIFSTGNVEIARSISNKDGYAYMPNVPIGVPFKVQVRTIVPTSDKRWSYTYEQIINKNDYSSYAKALGFSPGDNVYTLGTRGVFDSGLVVYSKTMLLDASNATKYICAKSAIDLPVEVYDIVVRVFDKTGKYLLRSQPVFLGPYPQATRPFLLNVTLVLADEYSPYDYASIWRDYSIGDFKILTDFRAIGITGMRSIYLSLASKYLDETKKALGCPQYTTANYSRAINAYALAAMAGYIANASTDRYAAVYLLTSQQPKDIIDICQMKPSQAGAVEIARLFMKGQRLRFVVWYLGQKVFDDYVTITGPLVDIKTDVYPINVTTYTKSMRLPVDTFVGFTITDVYLGLALNKTDGMFVNKSLVPQLIAPFNTTYTTYSLAYLLNNELVKGTAQQFNDNVTAWAGGALKDKAPYGSYVPAQFGGDFVYLPNLVVIRNATTPKYQFTILNRYSTTTYTYRSYSDTTASGSLQVPAGQTLSITLVGAKIEADPSNNATYVKLTSYNGAENVQPQLVINGSLVVINNVYVTNYTTTINANYTIVLTINAKCGSIQIAPGTNGLKITVNAGTCPAAVSYVATNRTYTTQTITVTAVPSTEYAVSFDRWFLVPYDWRFAQYNVLYHATNVVERNDILRVLAYTGLTQKCATAAGVTQVGEDDKYTYTLTLTGVEVVNYRTLRVELPWKTTGGGKAYVNITAYFTNGTLIDYKVYNLTEILAGARGTRVVVTLPLNFGKVAEKAYAIATKNLAVRYVIDFYMSDPTAGPYDVCATKLVPLAANYKTVSMYECAVPSAPGALERIDPTTVVYAIDKDLSNASGFQETFDTYGGFGTPITYVVKAGEIALLPSWYGKTSVAGSRIARLWIIAANPDYGQGPALGTKYYQYTVKDDKVTINIYKFEKYLVVNYIPNVCPAGWTTQTFLDEFDGFGRIIGLGFGASGTSALVLSNYTKVPMWNSTAMWLAGGAFKLPTVALDALTVQNTADFPIVVSSLNVRYGDYKYPIPMPLLRVDAGKTNRTLLSAYGFGRTYMISAQDVWNFRLIQPNYEYGLNAYHAGLLDAAKYFGLGDVDVAKYLRPLESKYFVQNVLYASHAETSEWTYNILGRKIAEWTRGRWGDLTVRSDDFDYKYVFGFPTLPLKEIRDWNDRPLANQTVALFDKSGRLYAVVYSNSLGRLVYPLPDLSNIGLSNVVRVAWYNGYLVELLRGKPEFTIWIYDQLIQRDVTELGDASTNNKIRTYVYPLTVTVKDDAGRPLTNMYVKVVDTSTVGQLVNAANKTGADGGAQVVDLRISKYSTGVLSQIPPTSYYYFVYDQSGALVAAGRFEIQRGASVPSTGWNVVATVRYATEIPVKNSATRGYLLIKGVEFLNGTKKDIKIPFTISGGVMVLGGKVPVSVEYPVEIYVTHVTLGGQEVPVKGGKALVFSGKTTDLLAGLDFAELGLTGVVTIQAVDASGAPRSDWTVQVLYGNLTAAQGAGQVQVVLPRTDVLDQPYVVRVITNAIAPNGKALVKEQTLELKQKALSLQIPVSTVKVVVQVIDGFGNVRSDWPVVVENVATGMGQVATELVDGQQYVARATGLGYTNTTTFVAKGPQMVVRIKIPTAKIVAQVVDGFGNVRSDWTVQVVGVTSGQGSIGPVEVLAGTYTVKTSVFGKEFSQTVNVQPGQTVTAAVQVPTAKLSVTAVDDDKKPLDRYVSSVELTGPLSLMFSTPPKDVEVLAGTYSIKVQALGKEASAQITLNPGEVKNIQVVVPGTAGLDIGGTRIPLPTLVLYGLLLLVVVVILAILIIEYNNWRRRRLMQILAPPK
ncbi:conserved hypothetical protein [Pyrobaculum islandicum DSM 4184]|uniref:Uncharacterized protein n=1 Tax=Pyrobaculum islandicum (strain DSM 4184 / JCM 9189 / GEO3) TaxID=384616 RepID=A1RTK0_PYRIL|nr:hypothetical protein [Pyrobaculum islandicum]ABL88282.1 conserved hypothetical protein [Pyrobaculum islandicum DSM 4184]